MKRFTAENGTETFAETAGTGASPTPTVHDDNGVKPEKYGLFKAPPAREDIEKRAMTEQEKHQEDLRVIDAVWGELKEGGPNYRNLGWIRASVLEVKSQIGLGVLALPGVLDTLGYVPGIILIIAIGTIITWSDYVVGTFKINHPEVYTLADVGYIIAGPVGREILGFAYWLETTAIAGSTLLAISIAFNAITLHATCTIVWVVIGGVIVGSFSSIQTLDRIAWIGWVGLISILGSLITLTVAVGINPPDQTQVITQAAANPSFVDAINAVSVIILAYAGTPNFFNIVGEMKQPKHYTKSVLLCQSFVTMIYLVLGCTIYHFVGQNIASPALGSAGQLMKRVCYGLALPGLVVGGVLYTHIPAKYIFVRLLRNSRHLSDNTWQHKAVWYGCVVFNTVISFVIAEAIPFFDDLVGLIGALLGTLICIQTEAYMWMWDNWRAPRTLQWRLLMAMNVFFFFAGWFLMVAGTYGSVVAIDNSFADGDISSPFSCADNSNSS